MKVYLGDAVYAEIDEWGGIWLTTGDGTSVTNQICLEPEVYQCLLDFHETAHKDAVLRRGR